MPRELDYGECLAVLSEHRFGRLGIRDADGVYIVPISYVLEQDVIYAHAPPGHKLHLLRIWRHVALEVDEVEGESRWRSVLVRAAFEEITSDEEKLSARLRLLRRFQGDVHAVTAGHGHRVALADATLFLLRIQSVSGRAENW